jgi:hypothetical protein
LTSSCLSKPPSYFSLVSLLESYEGGGLLVKVVLESYAEVRLLTLSLGHNPRRSTEVLRRTRLHSAFSVRPRIAVRVFPLSSESFDSGCRQSSDTKMRHPGRARNRNCSDYGFLVVLSGSGHSRCSTCFISA